MNLNNFVNITELKIINELIDIDGFMIINDLNKSMRSQEY